MRRLRIGCKIVYFYLLVLVGCTSSNKIPSEVYRQFEIPISLNRSKDYASIEVTVKNVLACPIRIIYNENTVATLVSQRDTIFNVPSAKEMDMNFKIVLGDPNQPTKMTQLSFPFSESKSYKIIQGYNGTFSHNAPYSKYALDFDLKNEDIICSVDDGYVVGLINDYKKSGSTIEWKHKGNYLTIYHPETGLYSQYVHFKYKGALVKLGDKVKGGQPIAISGMTGYTTVEHLHLNVLIPDSAGDLVSTPVVFKNGIAGESLKIGDIVKK